MKLNFIHLSYQKIEYLNFHFIKERLKLGRLTQKLNCLGYIKAYSHSLLNQMCKCVLLFVIFFVIQISFKLYRSLIPLSSITSYHCCSFIRFQANALINLRRIKKLICGHLPCFLIFNVAYLSNSLRVSFEGNKPLFIIITTQIK